MTLIGMTKLASVVLQGNLLTSVRMQQTLATTLTINATAVTSVAEIVLRTYD